VVLDALSSGQISPTLATAADLDHWARVRLTVMTRMIDRLEGSGYATRDPDPDDPRRSHIRLTDAGLNIKMTVSEALVAQLMEPIQALSADDRAALTTGLRNLHDIFGRLETSGLLEPSESEPLFDE
jgi:DNA-binding MarR family transcriptional regulator